MKTFSDGVEFALYPVRTQHENKSTTKCSEFSYSMSLSSSVIAGPVFITPPRLQSVITMEITFTAEIFAVFSNYKISLKRAPQYSKDNMKY